MSEVDRSGDPGGGDFQGRSFGVCPTPRSATHEATRALSVRSPVGGISPQTPATTSREPDPRLTSLSHSPDLDPRSLIQPTFPVIATRSDSFDSLPLRLFFPISFIQPEVHMHDEQPPNPGATDPSQPALRSTHRLRVTRGVGSHAQLQPGVVHPNAYHEGLGPGVHAVQTTNAARTANNAAPTPITPARYVLLHLAERMTGYTVKAMQRKIERGDWVEGKVWVRAPDGRLLVDMVGYHKWVDGSK